WDIDGIHIIAGKQFLVLACGGDMFEGAISLQFFNIRLSTATVATGNCCHDGISCIPDRVPVLPTNRGGSQNSPSALFVRPHCPVQMTCSQVKISHTQYLLKIFY